MQMAGSTTVSPAAPASRPIAAKDSLLCITLHHEAKIKPFAMQEIRLLQEFLAWVKLRFS